MQKRVLWGVLLLAGLVGTFTGCQYAEIASMGLDETRPGLVGPMLCDTLSVSEMAERVGESTKVYYRKDDDVAYVINSDTVRVPALSHIALRNTKSGQRVFTFNAGVPTSLPVEFTMIFVRPGNLAKAKFDAKRFDLVISCPNAPAGTRSIRGRVSFRGSSVSVPFEVGVRRVTTVSLLEIKGEVLNLLHKTAGKEERNQLMLDFTNLEVVGATTGEARLAIHAEAEGVDMKEAIGQSGIGGERLVGQQSGLSTEIFSTTVLADQSVPDVFFELEVQNAPFDMKLKVENLKALNFQNKDFLPDGREVRNKLPLGANALDLTPGATGNVVPKGSKSKVFRLDAQNSNIGELFGRGANRLSFAAITFEADAPSSNKDEVLPLAVDTVRLIKRCGMSIDGWVRSNLMRSRMNVDADFLGGGFAQADEKGVHAEKMKLEFVIANHIPMDVYARMTFEDKDGKPLFTLNFDQEKLAPGIAPSEKMGLFVPAAEVRDGFAATERTAYIEIPLTREEYERVAQNARSLRTEYLFRTAGAAAGQRVALRKQDYLRVNVSMRIDGRVDKLK